MIRSAKEPPRLEEADVAEMAPEFALVDTHGRLVRLSDYRTRKHIVLVFNRGFG